MNVNLKQEKIPFKIAMDRVIEVLAKQIYQSPLALLRENTQNAFDAILLRKQLDNTFNPRIEITINPEEIQIHDNGIGMSRADLKNHFWQAGSSSKNTQAARDAGVVGTFGIGAMANFGIASELIVITEAFHNKERTQCRALRETLSASEDCIEVMSEDPIGEPGTLVIAKILPGQTINVAEATQYVQTFVEHLDIPVLINGNPVSQLPHSEAVSDVSESWRFTESGIQIDSELTADVELVGSKNGEVRISLRNICLSGQVLSGQLILRDGMGALRTFRSGFGLATVSVSTVYQFGGVADFLVLEPTAGREALSTDSMQFLQSLILKFDSFVSEHLGSKAESNANIQFMTWASQHGRYDLCGKLLVRKEPESVEMPLEEVKQYSQDTPIHFYSGTDQTIIEAHASEETPLFVVSRRNPRRQCELEYLRQFCHAGEVSDQPTIVSRKPASSWSLAESSFAFRLMSILEIDYFVKASVEFGAISHALPVLIDQSRRPIPIMLNPDSSTLSTIFELHHSDYEVFGGMVKDFARSVIFPPYFGYRPKQHETRCRGILKNHEKKT